MTWQRRFHCRRRAHAHDRVRRRAEGRVGARARRDRRARRVRARPASSRSGSTTSSSATCCRRAATPSTARGTSALKAGVPIEVPALTVNRLCGSGIQAAVSGAQLIQLGRSGHRAGGRHGEHEPGAARDARPALGPQARARASSRTTCTRRSSTPTAACSWRRRRRTVPGKYGISREEQDAFALRSQQLRRAGVERRAASRDEVVPVEIKTRKGVTRRRQGRSPAAGHDAGGAREAAAGVLEGRHRHGRQRQRHRRRRRGADSGVARAR